VGRDVEGNVPVNHQPADHYLIDKFTFGDELSVPEAVLGEPSKAVA
jgi:hypothetical protein